MKTIFALLLIVLIFGSNVIHTKDLNYQPPQRYRKNANDKSSDILNHTAIIAHIANGIAIQAGLMDGTIKIDDLVGELLNFGDVPVSAITSFDPKPITTLTTKLKSTQSSLNSDFKDYEDQALNWNELIKESLAVGDSSNLPGRVEYVKSVTSFNANFNFTTSTALESSLINVQKKLDDINKVEIKRILIDSVYSDESYRLFNYLRMYLENVVDNINAFSTSLQSLKSTKLNTGPTVYEPVEKMIGLILKRKDYDLAPTDQKIAAIKENINFASKLSKDSQASAKEISNIVSLAVSRLHPYLTKKKFTDGFLNGVVDINILKTEVHNTWIAEITKVQNSKLAGLSNGLEPLFQLNDQLIKLDEKLKNLFSEKSSKSLENLKNLQKQLSDLKSESVDLSDGVLKGYGACGPPPVMENVYDGIKVVIKNSKILKKISEFELTGINLNELKTKREKFFTEFFPELATNAKASNDFGTTLKRIRDTDALKDIRKVVIDIKAIFDDLEVTDLKKNTEKILEEDKKFDVKLFDAERTLHGCLQDLKENSAKVALAISATQMLRNLNLDEVSDVESSVSVISEVSKGLSTAETFPETMKKEAKEETTRLNEFPDSLTKSIAIGKSVSSLHNAHVLKAMESEIAQLKSVKARVDSEIRKISNSKDRKKLLKQWGDHNSEMASLEKTIADVKNFDSKLKVPDNIENYGNLLKSLSTITDPKINPFQKLKALEFLISQPTLDPNVKPDLEQSKKTLDRLGELDLTFSSYRNQYENAPSAFKALHDFLESFLTMDHEKNNQEQTESSELVLYLVFTAIALLIIGLCIGLYAGLYRPKSLVKEFIKKHQLNDARSARIYHDSGLRALRRYAEPPIPADPYKFVPRNKQRTKMKFCNPETRVIVDGAKDGIHANWVHTRSKKCYIATQAPMRANKETNSEGTCDDFWLMACNKLSEFIVSCCKDNDPGCANYYSPEISGVVEFERFKITTKSRKTMSKDQVYVRVLEIEDKTGDYSKKEITHLQFREWEHGNILSDHVAAFEVLDMVKKSKLPVIVHDVKGAGRCMAFIGLQYCYEEILHSPKSNFYDVARELRKARFDTFDKVSELIWVLMGVFYQLIKKYKLSMEPYEEGCKIMLEIRPNLKKDEPSPDDDFV